MPKHKSDAILERLHRLHPQLIDLSLERIEGLLAKLAMPQCRLPPVIHVAGTNGKGSVVAMTKAILEAAGKRVHVYTSPHLVSFNERIQIPGADGLSRPIDEDHLIATLEEVERINAGAPMTFFEITTAAAFKLFAEIPADAVLLEVGLGGRFDATNVISTPRLSVITPVSLDHMDKLGDTVALIAREKAGIIKPGVPVVVAHQDGSAFDVIEAHAEAVGAPVIAAGRNFDAYEQSGRMVFQGEDMLLDLPLPALVGRHQIGNAGVAVASVLAIDEFQVDLAAIEKGLQSAHWPARMQRLKSRTILDAAGPGAEVWLDGGHNPAGGMAIARAMADLDERAAKPVVLIFGMLANKDPKGFLAPFAGLVRRVITIPFATDAGAHYPVEELARTAARLGIEAETSTDVLAALARTEALERGPRRILICGSLYLAGEVLALENG